MYNSDVILEPCDMRAGGSCGNHSAQIPLLLALPYVLRFVQCLIVYRTMSDTPQLFNALKYTTALPVVFLSFAKYHMKLKAWHRTWKSIWVASAVVNTSYSFYWDVERDWDIRLFHRSARNTTPSRAYTSTHTSRQALLHACVIA